MRRQITLTTAALAIALGAAAGPAQAATKPFDGPLGPADFHWLVQQPANALVLIGANDYGLVAPHGAYIKGP